MTLSGGKLDVRMKERNQGWIQDSGRKKKLAKGGAWRLRARTTKARVEEGSAFG